MRVPIRKGDPRMFSKVDPAMTIEKYEELKSKLEFMKKVKRPREAEEVKRLALMGDFSENAGYQLAKGRLRGLNQRILDLESLLGRAEIIKPTKDGVIRLGSLVTIEREGKAKKYRILGTAETDPQAGVISHNSPLGSALMGKKINDVVAIEISGRTAEYLIKEIE